jgi:hypothetical protein
VSAAVGAAGTGGDEEASSAAAEASTAPVSGTSPVAAANTPEAYDPGCPRTGGELAAALRSFVERCEDALAQIDDDELWAPQGAAWSPAEHVRHLTVSAAAVARGMEISLPILWLLFGRAGRGSRSFEVVRDTYLERLAAGAKASGRYLPAAGPSPAAGGALTPRDQLLEEFRRASRRLLAAVERWHEVDLDRFRLPHPILGRLTVREMLFFTVYHQAHHLNRLLARRAPARVSAHTTSGAP